MDSHKHYPWVEQEEVETGQVRHGRLTHAPGAVRQYLAESEPGTAVAVEATGTGYWIVDEIEQAGLPPLLVHPRKAKLMMGMIHKTDHLDAHPAEAGPAAHAAEESDHGDAEQVRRPGKPTERSVCERRAQRVGTAPWGVAGASGWASRLLLGQLDLVRSQIEQIEKRLAATMALEIGDVARFPSAEHLAS